MVYKGPHMFVFLTPKYIYVSHISKFWRVVELPCILNGKKISKGIGAFVWLKHRCKETN